jgi:hypothetical protein
MGKEEKNGVEENIQIYFAVFFLKTILNIFAFYDGISVLPACIANS